MRSGDGSPAEHSRLPPILPAQDIAINTQTIRRIWGTKTLTEPVSVISMPLAAPAGRPICGRCSTHWGRFERFKLFPKAELVSNSSDCFDNFSWNRHLRRFDLECRHSECCPRTVKLNKIPQGFGR